MGADLIQAQRRRVADELPEHAVSARRFADPANGRLVEAAGEEPRQPRLRVVEHADRRVARPRDLACHVEDPAEHRVEIELGDQRSTDVQQSAQTDVVEPDVARRGSAGGVGMRHRKNPIECLR